MDGIGPKENRPRMVNSNWGGTVEDNSFGTHDFFDLCEMLGCEPYLSGNVGSGTVEEPCKMGGVYHGGGWSDGYLAQEERQGETLASEVSRRRQREPGDAAVISRRNIMPMCIAVIRLIAVISTATSCIR